MFHFLFDWLIYLINTLGDVWTWLVTDTTILGYDIAPIYLVGGGLFITGIIRAITGVL